MANTKWRIKGKVGEGAAPSFNITFEIANGIQAGSDGNPVPSESSTLTIPCRLRRSDSSIDLTELFPGVDKSAIRLEGWINDRENYTFPASFRRQGNQVGSITYNGIKGRILIRILGVTQAADRIGERFEAVFTPE